MVRVEPLPHLRLPSKLQVDLLCSGKILRLGSLDPGPLEVADRVFGGVQSMRKFWHCLLRLWKCRMILPTSLNLLPSAITHILTT